MELSCALPAEETATRALERNRKITRRLSGMLAGLVATGSVLLAPQSLSNRDIPGPRALARAEIARLSFDAAHGMKETDASLPQEAYNRAELLGFHNIARAEAGLPPLKLSLALDTTAQARAQYLVQHNKFEHIVNWWAKPGLYLQEEHPHLAGLGDPHLGENLARGQNANQTNALMELWLNSPEHYKNIADPKFTEVGFGEAMYKDGQELIVAHFGGFIRR